MSNIIQGIIEINDKILGVFRDNIASRLPGRMLLAAVQQIPPLRSSSESAVDIISVTSHVDMPMLLLGLKSLIYFSKYNYKINIFDDGTLTQADVEIMKENILSVNYISCELYDLMLKKVLRKNSSMWRLRGNPYIKKKLVAHFCTNKGKLLFFDSDIIFFRKPKNILDWIDNKYDAFYMRDIQNSYVISNIESRYLFGVNQISKLNSGLLGLRKSQLSLQVLSKLIQFYESLNNLRTPHIQSYFAVLYAKNIGNYKILALPEDYVVSDKPEAFNPATITCGHYVTPVREKYFEDAKVVINTLMKKL